MVKQKTPTKIQRVLAILVSGQSLNKIEALPHGEVSMNSTISTLRNHYNLTIADTWETHTGPNGSALVKRYWIPEGEPAEQASKLLALMAKRTAKGVSNET